MIFSGNRTSLYAYNENDIVANTDYFGEAGAQQIMAENYRNDFAIFEGLLLNDFQELALGESVEEIEALQEASMQDYIDRIKEFLHKVWEKIKGLFKTFIAKLNIFITKDNKKLVNKYRKSLVGKDLSKMKYKYADRKVSYETLSANIGKLFEDLKNFCKSPINAALKDKDEIEDNEYIDKLLSSVIDGSTTDKDFRKDFHEYVFDDEEEKEGLNNLRDIEDILVKSSKTIDKIKKAEKEVNKNFSATLSHIDSLKGKLSKEKDKYVDGNEFKKAMDKDNGSALSSINKQGTHKVDNVGQYLNLIHTLCIKSQSATTKYVSALMAETKFEIKQARAVYSKAITFNPKAVKESATMLEAVGEASDYEIESLFESYEF